MKLIPKGQNGFSSINNYRATPNYGFTPNTSSTITYNPLKKLLEKESIRYNQDERKKKELLKQIEESAKYNQSIQIGQTDNLKSSAPILSYTPEQVLYYGYPASIEYTTDPNRKLNSDLMIGNTAMTLLTPLTLYGNSYSLPQLAKQIGKGIISYESVDNAGRLFGDHSKTTTDYLTDDLINRGIDKNKASILANLGMILSSDRIFNGAILTSKELKDLMIGFNKYKETHPQTLLFSGLPGTAQTKQLADYLTEYFAPADNSNKIPWFKTFINKGTLPPEYFSSAVLKDALELSTDDFVKKYGGQEKLKEQLNYLSEPYGFVYSKDPKRLLNARLKLKSIELDDYFNSILNKTHIPLTLQQRDLSRGIFYIGDYFNSDGYKKRLANKDIYGSIPEDDLDSYELSNQILHLGKKDPREITYDFEPNANSGLNIGLVRSIPSFFDDYYGLMGHGPIGAHEVSHWNMLYNTHNHNYSMMRSYELNYSPYYKKDYSQIPEPIKELLKPSYYDSKEKIRKYYTSKDDRAIKNRILNDHDLELNESYSDLGALRYNLFTSGIFDSRKSGKIFTKDMLKKYIEHVYNIPFSEKEITDESLERYLKSVTEKKLKNNKVHRDSKLINKLDRFIRQHTIDQIINSINLIASNKSNNKTNKLINRDRQNTLYNNDNIA